MSDLIARFKQLKNFHKQKDSELSEAKGRLNALKQQCKEEFGTHVTEDLNKFEKKYKKRLEQLEEEIDTIEEDLDQLLEQIEE